MKYKTSNLSQVEINKIVTKRLINEMLGWPEELCKDVFSPINKEFNIDVKFVNQLKDVARNTDTEKYASVLDDILDEIASNDGFGTEQQCDPRGDFRNEQWSMWNIQY